jgi:hypothetical protein
MLPPSRRSKRLQRKLTGKDDLIGTESEDVSVSREDGKSELFHICCYLKMLALE